METSWIISWKSLGILSTDGSHHWLCWNKVSRNLRRTSFLIRSKPLLRPIDLCSPNVNVVWNLKTVFVIVPSAYISYLDYLKITWRTCRFGWEYKRKKCASSVQTMFRSRMVQRRNTYLILKLYLEKWTTRTPMACRPTWPTGAWYLCTFMMSPLLPFTQTAWSSSHAPCSCCTHAALCSQREACSYLYLYLPRPVRAICRWGIERSGRRGMPTFMICHDVPSNSM